MFKDKVLLITGGTGSFGNMVLKRFIDTDIKEIRIFSRDEKKQEEIRFRYNNEKIKFYIGDIRDYNSIVDAMEGVDFVFHAAALKQIPSCEFFPLETIKTNVLGTNNVLEAAIIKGVKKVICLSTDKAAYPINTMGISKALMEKIAIAKGRNLNTNQTVICRTRYGNVMASRGSVIPLFINQIEAGEELTITNPNMTRFMMTLDEAIDLVLYAFEYGKQGDLFVQKSAAVTIETLAQAIIELKKTNTGIKYIGERHSEKLFEVLVTKEEMMDAIDLGKYYRIPCDNRNMNYFRHKTKSHSHFDNIKEYNSHNTKRLNVEEMKELLLKLDLFK